MADENNYTTIRIREDSRKKLDLLKEGTDLTFSDVIENLLKTVGGTLIKDVAEVKRDGVAVNLQFIDFVEAETMEYDITFHELQDSKIGDKFYANPSSDIKSNNYVNETAEVLFIDEDSVFMRIRESIFEDGKETRLVNMIHVDLF